MRGDGYKRALIILAFVSTFVATIYQGCSKPYKQREIASTSLAKSLHYEVKIYDIINAVERSIPLEKPEVASLVDYKVLITDLQGQGSNFNGNVEWAVLSTPADICVLSPSDTSKLEALLQCSSEGSIVLSIKIQPELDKPENSETLEPSFSVLQESSLRSKGILLYQTHCNACHSASGSGLKQNKTADDIGGSIAGVATMRAMESLKLLSPTELRAIAESTQPNMNDSVDPVVSILNPTADQVVSGIINAEAMASDNVGVLGVRWQIDNIDYGVEDFESPYTVALNAGLLVSGSHTLKAIARDGAGNLGIVVVTFIISAYDNYSVPESVLAASYPVNNDNILAGEALYSNKCLSCHAIDSKRNRSYALYRQMVGVHSSVSQMQSIDMISADLYKVYIYLNNFVTGNSTSIEQSTSLIGTRTYMFSYFQNIFVSSAGNLPSDGNINNLITNLLLKQAGSLGGACQANDATDTDPTCKVNLLQTSNGSMLPQSSALRRGYITRACEEVLSINQAVENALAKVGINSGSPLTTANISKVYDLFTPDRPLPMDVSNSLMGVATNSDLSLGIDRWRFVLYSLCRTAGVESF